MADSAPDTPVATPRRAGTPQNDFEPRDAYDAMLGHIYTEVQQSNNNLLNEEDTVSTGVVLRTDAGEYRLFPPHEPALYEFRSAVAGLRAVTAVKLHNASISAVLSMLPPTEFSLFVGHDTRVQVIETMGDLPLADREQCAAFVRDEHVLVLWVQHVHEMLPLCAEFDKMLHAQVMSAWRTQSAAAVALPPSRGTSGPNSGVTSAAVSTFRNRPSTAKSTSTATSATPASGPSESDLPGPSTHPDMIMIEKVEPDVASDIGMDGKPKGPVPPSSPPKKRGLFSFGRNKSTSTVVDIEKGKVPTPRPTVLMAPIYGGAATALTIFFIGCGVNVLLIEAMLDGGFLRFALLLTTPFVFCVALFFSCQLVSNIFFCIGPVGQYHINSKYYSAIPPIVDPNDPRPELPHVTIQMPVYKEGLEAVIMPSVESLKKAMLTYARQGGTCSIFMCDDGLQLISEKDRLARQVFYENQGIGWVARPKHINKKGAFQRAGRFKKASNLNFGLAMSRAMEVHILAIQAEEGMDAPNVEERALAKALEERNAELHAKFVQPFLDRGEEPPAPVVEGWAKNARALRVGAVILIVDADTVVPTDCLRDAALELAESPHVAIIQHESAVLMVANHWFEHGIAHFTRRINRCISMGCANGEVAPFVGHNAFLRWSAIQEVAFVDKDDGVKKIWSESNVSEDFDMALRLQLAGYIIRWATYSDGGFKEGVSLTVDDELNRWQKYAYGCSELLFYPLIQWFRHGPIQPQLKKFIWSSVPLHSKLTTLSYIFSYYGIAGAVMLSVINYVLVGLTLDIDAFYVHSWEVWLSCTVVFIGMGNVAFTLLEYRLGKESLLHGTWTTVKWIPFFFFFFGGLSWPLTTALLSHLFCYNIQWSSTVKEVELSNFFVEVPRITRLFWRTFLMAFTLIAIIVVMSTSLIPEGWRVTDYAVIFPLALTAGSHILFPIALNPWLLKFTF